MSAGVLYTISIPPTTNYCLLVVKSVGSCTILGFSMGFVRTLPNPWYLQEANSLLLKLLQNAMSNITHYDWQKKIFVVTTLVVTTF